MDRMDGLDGLDGLDRVDGLERVDGLAGELVLYLFSSKFLKWRNHFRNLSPAAETCALTHITVIHIASLNPKRLPPSKGQV